MISIPAQLAIVLFAGPLAPAPGPEPEPHIYEGTVAQGCEWPTMVMPGFLGCTATLVSPWIVITAAHCVGNVENPGEVLFGPAVNQPRQSAPVEYCRRNPEYDSSFNNGVNGSDISYCKLAEPVYDIAFTPIVYGCETEILRFNEPAAIVGVGANAEDGSGFGLKRFSDARISFVPDELIDGIAVGEVFNAACSGDSGGPAYVQYPDGSWHVFGVVSGGPPPCGGGADTYAVMSEWVPWIEEDSGVDVTPCHDVDGTWNPTGWCQGFEMEPYGAEGDWDNWCVGEVSPPSTTCGAAFNAEPDDDPPTVAFSLPEDETILTGGPVSVDIAIEADDGEGHGVRSVTLSINGQVQDLDFREPPYEVTATFPQGSYELVAIAEDWSGNVGESEVLRMAVDDELPPLPEAGSSSGGDNGTLGEGTAGDGTAGLGTSGLGSSDSGEPGAADGADDGCACRASGRRGGGWSMLALAGLMLGLRRRRAGPR